MSYMIQGCLYHYRDRGILVYGSVSLGKRAGSLLSVLDRQAFHAVERYLYREISLLLQHLLGVCAVIEYHSLKLSMNRRKEAACRGAFHIRYQDFYWQE